MSRDYLKGHRCMVWTFMGNARMYSALAAYGDRLSQVGLFSFKVRATGDRKSTRLNSSHKHRSRMPSSA